MKSVLNQRGRISPRINRSQRGLAYRWKYRETMNYKGMWRPCNRGCSLGEIRWADRLFTRWLVAAYKDVLVLKIVGRFLLQVDAIPHSGRIGGRMVL